MAPTSVQDYLGGLESGGTRSGLKNGPPGDSAQLSSNASSAWAQNPATSRSLRADRTYTDRAVSTGHFGASTRGTIGRVSTTTWGAAGAHGIGGSRHVVEKYCGIGLVVLHPNESAYEAARAMEAEPRGGRAHRGEGASCAVATDRDLALRVIGRGLDAPLTPLTSP